MLIEIRGTGFVNKGAELMLRSIISNLRKNIPEAMLAVPPYDLGTQYLQRAELGLYQKIWLQRYRVQWGDFGGLIPRRLRQTYGMVIDSEVDVVLDASGFAYSDQWGPGSTLAAVKAMKKWKKQGSKVIFMPQAFGPFTDENIKRAFKSLVEQADLMFARDRVSYDYITQLVGERENVTIAPDFTNLIQGKLPENFDKVANRFCVIPNYRMIDKTSSEQSKAYLPFLITCVKYLLNQGKKPFILIHEGDNDLWLGQEIVKSVGQDINIVRETNAVRIKGIVGASEGVISSRFHGLVSALSQGVPALATGWSHKYEMLFQDYFFPEGMSDVNSSFSQIQNKIDLIISDTSKMQIQEKIISACKTQKKASTEMWDTIYKIIK